MRIISILGGIGFLALSALLFSSIYVPNSAQEPLSHVPILKIKNMDNLAPLQDQDLTQGFVLLTFFATWCIPCAMEHPQLMDLAKDKNLKLYGIAHKDDLMRLKGFLQDHGNPFIKVGLSPDGAAGVDFGISGVPETFLIHNGQIIRRFKSGLMAQDCVEIQALIHEATQ